MSRPYKSEVCILHRLKEKKRVWLLDDANDSRDLTDDMVSDYPKNTVGRPVPPKTEAEPGVGWGWVGGWSGRGGLGARVDWRPAGAVAGGGGWLRAKFFNFLNL